MFLRTQTRIYGRNQPSGAESIEVLDRVFLTSKHGYRVQLATHTAILSVCIALVLFLYVAVLWSHISGMTLSWHLIHTS